MRVNVYAEETEPTVEGFEPAKIGTLVEKEKDGVRYYGMQIGISTFDSVTYWFTSMKTMRQFFIGITEALP